MSQRGVVPVVIDASAGVELITDTQTGRQLRNLIPANAVPWVPETFFVEVGSVLRRWDLNRVLTPTQIASALDQLATWPLRVAQLRPLFMHAWRHRHNITFADATYVALAEHLGAAVLTADHRLAHAPTLPVQVLSLATRP